MSSADAGAAPAVGTPPQPDAFNQLFFDDLEEGMSWTSRRRTLGEADLIGFAGLSGDFNPLHVDELSAAGGPYDGRVIHGMLVLSVATGLRQQMGIFLGSMKAMLELRSWRFLAPVLVGDTIAVVTTIESLKRSSKGDQGVVVQKVDVVNQRGETVQSGVLVSLMRTRP